MKITGDDDVVMLCLALEVYYADLMAKVIYVCLRYRVFYLSSSGREIFASTRPAAVFAASLPISPKKIIMLSSKIVRHISAHTDVHV